MVYVFKPPRDLTKEGGMKAKESKRDLIYATGCTARAKEFLQFECKNKGEIFFIFLNIRQ